MEVLCEIPSDDQRIPIFTAVQFECLFPGVWRKIQEMNVHVVLWTGDQ